ncbi:MAG: lysylphosphatidylglycerol synthase transmembrane domain-containing protein [Dehalococcoidia bacterium]|nr:lysylphosphatidylglycerol synthase transmembrane domain-containing protein [Dehalococcoidia bacterium]
MRSPRFWLGLAVSLLFLGLLLWRVDLQETMRSLREANYWFVILGVPGYFAGVALRAARWRILLSPLRPLAVRRLFPVVVVGYMANNLLPVRLGELVRSYYLGQREGVSKSAALATILVERVVDGVVLLFVLVALSLVLPVTGLVTGVARSMSIPWPLLVSAVVAPFVLVLGVMVFMAYDPPRALALTGLLVKPLPARLKARLLGLAEMFIAGLGVLRYPRRIPLLILLSLLVWLAEGTMYYLVGLSFGLASPLGGLASMAAAMLAVEATSNLGAAFPSSQGSIGPFELFTVATLVVLGVQREAAVAYAVVLHVALLVPVTLLGMLYLWMGKESLVQLVRLGTSGDSIDQPSRAGEAP